MEDVGSSSGVGLIENDVNVEEPIGVEELIGVEEPNEPIAVEVHFVEPDSILKPFVGQVFGSEDEAYACYNAYARICGFGIRKNSTKKVKGKDEIRWRQFVCDKEGAKIMKDGRNVHPREQRMGCNGKMNVGLTDEKWVVKQFVDEHSHILTTPTKTHMYRSHARIHHRQNACKQLIHHFSDVGIGPAKISRVVNASAGGDVWVTPKQVQQELKKKRSNNMGNEAGVVVKYFQELKNEDPEFYFAVEIDDDMSLRSLFWADCRARNSYIEFGDVIVFDATYKTNKFKMPFAPFTGVNHHMQSTLFGCALLADETEETFVWLFGEWLKCMFGKAPQVIITDMCPAMKNAICRVLPQTRHRFCSWHINRHAYEHLSLLRMPTSGFGNYYFGMINSKTIANCEAKWEALREKFTTIEGDSWLLRMWDLRHHWISAYFKDVFTAGMSATSRSEGMNAFFDGYVGANTSLQCFVEQYDKALVSRRMAEELEDFKTITTRPTFITSLEIERQAGSWYTRKVFVKFQEALTEGFSMKHERISKSDGVTTYLVGAKEDIGEKDKKWVIVQLQVLDDIPIVTCGCSKFDTKGMICAHMLLVICKKQIDIIPDCYLLNRWSINARYRKCCSGNSGSSGVEKNNPVDIWRISARFHELFRDDPLSHTLLKKIEEGIERWHGDKQMEHDISEANEQSMSTVRETVVDSVKLTSEISIKDPKYAKHKGRPSNSRLKSAFEISHEDNGKKKRKCGQCGEKGHYITSCPKKAKM